MIRRSRISRLLLPAVAVLLLAAPRGLAAPAPPVALEVVDHPGDGGDKLDLRWRLSADDPGAVKAYRLLRTLSADEIRDADADAVVKAAAGAKARVTREVLAAEGVERDALKTLSTEARARLREVRATAAAEATAAARAEEAARAGADRYKFVTFVPKGSSEFTVENLQPEVPYRFRLIAVDDDGSESAPVETLNAVAPTPQFFDRSRWPLAVIVFLICGSVIFYIQVARSGRTLKIRKIAGLEAVHEAVGRATEMGRSVLFVPGIQDMNDIQTIAGLTVLSQVAKTAAEYDAQVEVPTTRSLVMTAARETVQASFLSAGRPDAYNESLIYYVTDEQFGYVAYLSGAMVREKPAACFYMGAFFAESLILAETGNSIGAIQVAGTAMPAQLPFFVAACDYTLIGEEFFAASAYLSGQPEQLGSLKGQDVGKVIVAAIMIVGIALSTAASLTDSAWLSQAAAFIRDTLLT
jgi:hypothetical protein